MADFIAGRNPVLEALKSGRSINKILLSKTSHGTEEIIDLAKSKGVLYEFVDRSVLDRGAKDTKHQGVVAFVSAAKFVEVEDLLEIAKSKNELPFIVLLDGVEDPQNLGAILRTVDAAGAHGVVISKHRAASPNETVAKTSAGAVEHVPIARVTNLNDAMKNLKDNRVWMFGLDGEATTEITKADFKTAVGLVLGSEGNGLSRLVKENCDFLVKIPMHGKIGSLNVSVSSAIAMYEVVRQRKSLV
ncbi:23S rRNA (guanosine(2251)-2'-O)-methyltransferase RlmB [Candidatus Saganbacteria bacterium]|nr:23S rRNA (guanosine(2251)-2'-O)-methyltransferase RlmB [Candidatus Saganbacteria bacterium]